MSEYLVLKHALKVIGSLKGNI